MLFADALECLKNGELVRRESWLDVDGYLVLLPGMKNVWKILTNPAPNAGNHIFSVEELSADDWVAFKELEVPAPVADDKVEL